MILIIGANGSMGKRYQAILRSLEIPFDVSDIETTHVNLLEKINLCSGVIIATPTNSHLHFISLLFGKGKPVLCEKPLSMNSTELKHIKRFCQDGLNLTMMMQYKYFITSEVNGPSSYDYFRHGNDGLSWDCIQIIGLARSSVSLKEESPIWKCKLNGLDLSLNNMDEAYVWAVQKWLDKPGDDIDELIKIHEKVAKYEEEYGLL